MKREEQLFLNYNCFPNEWAWPDPQYPSNRKELKKYFGNDNFGSWWRYHNYELMYNHNDYGYRGVTNFKDLDWSKTVALYGCSYIYSQCVNEHETISHYLQALLNTPVVNMGIPGSGIEVQYWNMRWLNKKFHPKWNVVFWPYDDRIVVHQGLENKNIRLEGNGKPFQPHWQTNMWMEKPSVLHPYGLTPNYLVSEDLAIRLKRFKKVAQEDFKNLTEYTIHDKIFKTQVDPILGRIQSECGMGSKDSVKSIRKRFIEFANSDKETQHYINHIMAKDAQLGVDGTGIQGHYGPKYNRNVAKVIAEHLKENPRFT